MKKRATVLKYITLGEDAYDLALCESHADLFETQMYAWTRVAQLVTVAPPPWTPERTAKVAVPTIAVVEEIEDSEPPLWQDEIPDGVRTLLEDYPHLQEWRLSRKARERAQEDQIELFTVLLAAEAPSESEPSQRDEEVTLHTRGTVTAVVNARTKTVLTAYRRREGNVRGTQAS